jgi:hypothetical protein
MSNRSPTVRTRAISIALAVSALSSAAYGDDLRPYLNARFGSYALVPKDWPSLPPPENGDGLIFVSPDQRARITVSGSFNLSPGDDGPVLSTQSADGFQPTYAKRGKGWAVASGVKDGTIIYRKTLTSCHGTISNDLDIEYPIAQKAAYNRLVGRIAASLAGGCGIYQ